MCGLGEGHCLGTSPWQGSGARRVEFLTTSRPPGWQYWGHIAVQISPLSSELRSHQMHFKQIGQAVHMHPKV